jgi:hypothetical protein
MRDVASYSVIYMYVPCSANISNCLNETHDQLLHPCFRVLLLVSFLVLCQFGSVCLFRVLAQRSLSFG